MGVADPASDALPIRGSRAGPPASCSPRAAPRRTWSAAHAGALSLPYAAACSPPASPSPGPSSLPGPRSLHAAASLGASALLSGSSEGSLAEPLSPAQADSAAELQRKVVVLGVPWQTDREALEAHFAQFGAVEAVQLMRERHTGKSRGFGFVTFADAASALRAVGMRHTIDGRKCEAKLALPEGRVFGGRTCRIFVARIPATVSDAEFRSYFERFGPVHDAYMPKEPRKVAHRGIGFVTYASPDAVEAVMASTHVLGGNEVAIDRATPKDRGGGGSVAAAPLPALASSASSASLSQNLSPSAGSAGARAAALQAQQALQQGQQVLQAQALPGRLSMSQPNLALLGGGSGHGLEAYAAYLRASQGGAEQALYEQAVYEQAVYEQASASQAMVSPASQAYASQASHAMVSQASHAMVSQASQAYASLASQGGFSYSSQPVLSTSQPAYSSEVGLASIAARSRDAALPSRAPPGGSPRRGSGLWPSERPEGADPSPAPAPRGHPPLDPGSRRGSAANLSLLAARAQAQAQAQLARQLSGGSFYDGGRASPQTSGLLSPTRSFPSPEQGTEAGWGWARGGGLGGRAPGGLGPGAQQHPPSQPHFLRDSGSQAQLAPPSASSSANDLAALGGADWGSATGGLGFPRSAPVPVAGRGGGPGGGLRRLGSHSFAEELAAAGALTPGSQASFQASLLAAHQHEFALGGLGSGSGHGAGLLAGGGGSVHGGLGGSLHGGGLGGSLHGGLGGSLHGGGLGSLHGGGLGGSLHGGGLSSLHGGGLGGSLHGGGLGGSLHGGGLTGSLHGGGLGGGLHGGGLGGSLHGGGLTGSLHGGGLGGSLHGGGLGGSLHGGGLGGSLHGGGLTSGTLYAAGGLAGSLHDTQFLAGSLHASQLQPNGSGLADLLHSYGSGFAQNLAALADASFSAAPPTAGNPPGAQLGALLPSSASYPALAGAQARSQGAPGQVGHHLPGSSSGGFRQGPAQSRAGPRIFVGKLPREVGEADVREYFGQFGFVLDVYLPRDKANRREHRGFGFVTYETEAAVRRVVSRGSHQIKGVYVAIDAAEPRGEEGGRGEDGGDESGGAFSPGMASGGGHAALDACGLDDALEQRQHRRNLFLGGLGAEPEAEALRALTRLGLESVPEDR